MLKIATFNLFNYIEPPYACYDFDRIYDEQQWQKKQTWIRDYLSEHQPDVIGFQEVFSPDSLKALVAECDYPYFAVVDSADVIEDYIFRSPVVALASRYPITDITAVIPDSQLAADMGLSPEYQFSRKPLRASIELPHLGTTDCYVVHFKSKRPMLESDDNELATTKAVLNAFTKQMCGTWGSSIQRGSEAVLLFQKMIQRRLATNNPMMLMGDFNDRLDNDRDGVLSHLTMDTLRFNSDPQAQDIVKQFSLQDSWHLYQHAANGVTASCTPAPRPPTHYFFNKGSVLDYILLSCEFNAEYQRSLYEVSDYHTYDRHLINPIYARDSESTDHAVVQINLQLRT
ncbi:endonuclease/exonuclease/phosphatase family protein [Moritella marina ATCC 15381]|uniref:Endonuclease/exonuclease/phosphatase family protein n=1 Tax=Moritella marina ATCC 15381 TaxID=1202962 RepID=A0A5J6WGM5_MORMI|nr:endonuclease/exonuclease/phosphatase family protein [Moritella marina]QFI37117.1 endonuclease/exonuclease/phosphatase family protein [Moritella marina ATCC 15381]